MSKDTKDKSKSQLFKQWKQRLSNTRLTPEQQIKRAKEFTRKGMKPND